MVNSEVLAQVPDEPLRRVMTVLSEDLLVMQVVVLCVVIIHTFV